MLVMVESFDGDGGRVVRRCAGEKLAVTASSRQRQHTTPGFHLLSVAVV